jgi:hypothetical protein
MPAPISPALTAALLGLEEDVAAAKERRWRHYSGATPYAVVTPNAGTHRVRPVFLSLCVSCATTLSIGNPDAPPLREQRMRSEYRDRTHVRVQTLRLGCVRCVLRTAIPGGAARRYQGSPAGSGGSVPWPGSPQGAAFGRLTENGTCASSHCSGGCRDTLIYVYPV